MGAFDGGEITSDAGGLLLREAAGRLNLFERMAACFEDRRNRKQVTHPLPDLLAPRVIAMALGYEDLNDHDRMRNDPLLKVTAAARCRVARRCRRWPGVRRWVGWSGVSRRPTGVITNSPFSRRVRRIYMSSCSPVVMRQRRSRSSWISTRWILKRMGISGAASSTVIMSIAAFCRFYIYCGPHLLLSKLRPGNVDGAEGAKATIKRVVGNIRRHWPQVSILVRGDSGFARANLMNWCEANGVDYIFGLPHNDYLLHKARKIRSRAAMAFLATGETAELFGNFHHQTRSGNWARPRHVIAKVLHRSEKEQSCRFLVTSLDWNALAVIDSMAQARDRAESQGDKPPRDRLA